MRLKTSAMPWPLVILAGSMLLSVSCAVKHLPAPAPLIGVDIAHMNKGDAAPFNGVLMSPAYLNSYLEWKCKDQGAC